MTTIEQARVEVPYVGPVPFTRADRARFFGRSAEIDELVSLVYAQPQLCIHAASGAGKTSLVNAGLLPALGDQGFDVLPPGRVRGAAGTPPPDGTRCRYMYEALQSLAEDRDEAVAPDETLAGFLAARGDDHMQRRVPRVVVFDQFEEILTIYSASSREEQVDFFRQVAEAIEADPLLRVLLLVREDRLVQVESFADYLPDGLGLPYRLPRLDKASAIEAIVRPAELAGRGVTPDAAELLVDRLARARAESEPGEFTWVPDDHVEPVQLQLVCESLWRQSGEGDITVNVVRSVGDVGDALARHYDRVVARVARAHRVAEARLRRWFEDELITPMRTRGTAFQGETTTEGMPNDVVAALEDSHLVRGERRAAGRWYELVHDSFIDSIQESNRAFWERERGRRRRRRLVLMAGLVVVGFVVGGATVSEVQGDAGDFLTEPVQIEEDSLDLRVGEERSFAFPAVEGDTVAIVAEPRSTSSLRVAYRSPDGAVALEDLSEGGTFVAMADVDASGRHEVTVSAAEGDATVAVGIERTEGSLDVPGRASQALDDEASDTYVVVASGPVVADLRSDDFDPVVAVTRLDGEVLGENDDGGAGLDSLLIADLPPAPGGGPGVYLVTVSPYGAPGSGAYDLTLSRPGGPLTVGHTLAVDTSGNDGPTVVPLDESVRSVSVTARSDSDGVDAVTTVVDGQTYDGVNSLSAGERLVLDTPGPEAYVVVGPGHRVDLTARETAAPTAPALDEDVVAG